MSGSITARELRQMYLRFFESKGHSVYPSGSLIPVDVTGKLDESLLFNGAGMIQFKPYFRGISEPKNRRLTTAQKCVRTGDIDEVGDDSHLTFFEMLGNFSFGDYFKKEAIAYSWEFMTSKEWLHLDPNRLAFTVFNEDEKAYILWTNCLLEAGLNPKGRVFKLGEETNYWPAGSYSNGPPGPCGPNSEMFYWFDPSSQPPDASSYSSQDFQRDEVVGKWLEIWNDVFISFEWQGEVKNPSKPFEGWKKTGMPDLPFRSVDTGMGLERTVAVLTGKNSVYDTDAFEPLIEKLGDIAPISYLDAPRAYRIICDHLRAAVFCIADSILPSNTGRGYVLRRLLRRAILQGFSHLNIKSHWLPTMADAIIENFGDHYTELKERRQTISEVLAVEEQMFRKTIEDGVERIEKLLANQKGGRIAGEDAFKLYDTYGFPLELTIELASEKGWTVDEEGYEVEMNIAKERSRAGQDRDTVYGNVQSEGIEHLPATIFLGYEYLEADCEVIFAEFRDGKTVLVFDQTPFYASSGGQISDIGNIQFEGLSYPIIEVRKKEGRFLHAVEANVEGLLGKVVHGIVDSEYRLDIKRNHTGTHLLHAALHEVVGKHASQAGSYVGPDRLRFDFTHSKPVEATDLQKIESIVNFQILRDEVVKTYVDLPIAEAKSMGAMALFGEKYGDKVRMVEVGSFSRELCGGTHVSRTGEIGPFKILSEGSVSSGVRRIEAITGNGTLGYVNNIQSSLQEAANRLKTSPNDLIKSIEKQQDTIKDLKKQLEKALANGGQDVQSIKVNGFEIGYVNLGETPASELQKWVERYIAGGQDRVGLAAGTYEGKAYLALKVSETGPQRGLNAGTLIRDIAKVAGGGGGGNPIFATAGGRDPSKIEDALQHGVKIIQAALDPA